MDTRALDLEVKRINKIEGMSSLKAFCDVVVANAVFIRGVKVVEGKNGLFVSMPREQSKQGQWYDVVMPVNSDLKKRLSEVVLQAYTSNEEPPF